MEQVLDWAAAGSLTIETETVPLAEIEQAWPRTERSRLIVVP